MARLPTPGSDVGQWGTVLNDFLGVEHNSDGTLKLRDVQGKIPRASLDASTIASLDNADAAAAGTVPDADATTKGKLQLAGDLSGTAAAPVVANNAITNAKISSSAAIDQSKIANLTTDLTAKYEKPVNGIPSSDLTTAVQTSLTKADSALQAADITSKANDNAVVHLTGAEAVAGVKTFSSSPIVPTPTTSTQAANKSYVDGQVVANASRITTFTISGTLATGFGQTKFMFPRAATILSVRAVVGTAPVGSSVIIDLNINGTTAFTTQANRPTIAAASMSSSKVTPDNTAIADGDYLTVDVDQIGSTTAGADLCVVVEYQ